MAPTFLGSPKRGSKRALDGLVEKSPSGRSQIVQGNPTTNVPKEENKEGLKEHRVYT